MANILDKYGIKEVCDITFYNIDSTTGQPTYPVLYIDTAKVSTLEQAAESVDATGGKGNVPLITWDYGRDITMTLEDALFSAKSLGVMFGAKPGEPISDKVTKTLAFTGAAASATPAYGAPTYWEGPKGEHFTISYTGSDTTKATIYAAGPYTYQNGETTVNVKEGDVVQKTDIKEGKAYFVKFDLNLTEVSTIDITASNFPGTYYITADTYARSEKDGKDSFFQLIIPKAKVLSEDVSLTMEAEGDPSTFQMNLKVLRNQKANGKGMVQLVKYNVAEQEGASYDTSIWSYTPSV